jgi:hypothetical protein
VKKTMHARLRQNPRSPGRPGAQGNASVHHHYIKVFAKKQPFALPKLLRRRPA